MRLMERWQSQWHEDSLCFSQVTIDKFLLNHTNEVVFSPLAEWFFYFGQCTSHGLLWGVTFEDLQVCLTYQKIFNMAKILITSNFTIILHFLATLSKQLCISFAKNGILSAYLITKLQTCLVLFKSKRW